MLSRLLKLIVWGDQGAGIMSGIISARPYTRSNTRISAMQALADIFVKGKIQIIMIYLFQSTDVRHSQVTVTSAHITE